MFKNMRRAKQKLSSEECSAILERGSFGVLAVCGSEGYPYSVPLSYAYLPERNSIIFHCSHKGHKVDILRENPRASLCVVDRDEPIPAEFATHYASVIAFGTVRFIDDDEEKRLLLTALGAKYSPGLEVEAQEEIDRFLKATCVIELQIEHISGKQAKALAEASYA